MNDIAIILFYCFAGAIVTALFLLWLPVIFQMLNSPILIMERSWIRYSDWVVMLQIRREKKRFHKVTDSQVIEQRKPSK